MNNHDPIDEVLQKYAEEQEALRKLNESLAEHAQKIVNGWAPMFIRIANEYNEKIAPLNASIANVQNGFGPNGPVGSYLSIDGLKPDHMSLATVAKFRMELTREEMVDVTFSGDLFLSEPIASWEDGTPAPEMKLRQVLAAFANHLLRTPAPPIRHRVLVKKRDPLII